MKILITTPSLKSPHGGTRILNEWAVQLSQWHEVTLLVQNGEPHCPWYVLPQCVRVTNDVNALETAEVVIIGSPHSIRLQHRIKNGQRCFIFLQMMEHMFDPQNHEFNALCMEAYLSPHPVIAISKWNINYLRDIGRAGVIHYVGNGVNLGHFPIEEVEKDGRTVLVEGWESKNVTKDTDAIGPKVAERLKADGYHIIAYSQRRLLRYAHVPDEYYYRPTLAQMNDIYRRATILVKATKLDARSTAPIEAMTKGTPTARAINLGDDDLVNLHNCMRGPYNEEALYLQAKYLLKNIHFRKDLSAACINYVSVNNWELWMPKINEILTN